MRNSLKKIALSLVIFFSLAMNASPSFSGEVNAPVETGEDFSIYIQKVAKTALFIENILESVTYVISTGEEGINAAVELLGDLAGNLGPFQEVLRFADSSSFGSILGTAKDALSGNFDSITGGSLNNLDLGGKANKLLGNVDADALAKDVLNLGGAGNGSGGAAAGNTPQNVSGSSNSNSAYARVGKVQGSYGAPQESKQAAEQYIRKMFFYSTKDGDKYDGEELTEADKALEAVKENRKGYLLEVISTAYATAVENRTSVYEDALKRYNDIKKEASSADTVDAKKAAETLIVQEETRQRINRLSLELSILEQDIIGDLFEEPENILIARTVEQIQTETGSEVQNVDFKNGSASKE